MAWDLGRQAWSSTGVPDTGGEKGPVMHTVQHVLGLRNLVTARPEQSAYEAACLMAESGVGALPIVSGGRLVGVFSERDLMTRVLVPRLDPKATAVGDVMTRDIVTAHVEERTESCVEKMRARNCRHLPVLSGNQLLAMLSMRDLLRDELEERDEEISHLRAYIHQPGPH